MKYPAPAGLLATTLLTVTLGALGCAAAPEPEDEAVASDSAPLLSSYEQSAAITVLDSGHWDSGYVYHGAWRESFWVDLSVRNDAFNKEVGIVWSSDGWTTQHTSLAHYKGALGGDRERWGLDVRDFATAGWFGMPEVQYAGYVRANGQTRWSVFRNHEIYDKVDRTTPVRLLRSSLSVGTSGDAAGRPVLEGAVRALNVPAERHVFVRYTTDGWRSARDAELAHDGRDFKLSVPLAVDPATVEQVEFAVRLEAAGETRWDNNGGHNFTHRLAPRLAALTLRSDAGRPAGGVEVLLGSLQSDLPIQGVAVRIDHGAPIPLSAPAGFTPGGGVLHPFTTLPLADGAHTIALEVTGAGGFQRALAGLSFAVRNDLTALPSWRIPAAAPSVGVSFDAQLGPDGSYLVLSDHTVARYDAIGSDRAPQVFATAPIDAGLHDLTLDGQGRVYGLGNDGSIVRWRADGALDGGFGRDGVLAVSGSWGSREICNVAAIEATSRSLYVLDSCNGRALRLSLEGALLAEIDLSAGPGAYAIVSAAFTRGGSVWVMRTRSDNGVSHADLIELDDAPDSALSALRTVPLDPAASGAQAFAVTPGGDGFWVSLGSDDVVRLDAGGAVVATWHGGGGDYDLPGALSLARRIEPLADGSVAVLSWGSGRVERLAAITR